MELSHNGLKVTLKVVALKRIGTRGYRNGQLEFATEHGGQSYVYDATPENEAKMAEINALKERSKVIEDEVRKIRYSLTTRRADKEPLQS
jgi:predicted transcriptional regulator